jgi:hypothetical protein
MGGTNELDNLRVICSECNLSMGTDDLEQYKTKFYGNASIPSDNNIISCSAI